MVTYVNYYHRHVFASTTPASVRSTQCAVPGGYLEVAVYEYFPETSYVWQ